MLCLFLSNQRVHPFVHLYKCVCLCEKFPEECVCVLVLVCAVHVVTVDIMLTSSRSSLPFSQWALGTSVKLFNTLLSALNVFIYFLSVFWDNTVLQGVFTPTDLSNSTSLQRRRWLDFLINRIFWAFYLNFSHKYSPKPCNVDNNIQPTNISGQKKGWWGNWKSNLPDHSRCVWSCSCRWDSVDFS